MLTVVALIHIIICLFLVGLVLLQDPKGGGAGGMFGGGGSGSLLGATGAVTFLTRLTRYSAILFGITCLILSLLSKPNIGSVIDSMPTAPASAPAPGTGLNGALPGAGAPPPGAAAPTGGSANTAPVAPSGGASSSTGTSGNPTK